MLTSPQLTADLDLRLSDFGSSVLIHPVSPPTDGLGLGTLPFSPPELVDPTRSFSFPVDMFSLGATLYQCLSGAEPYRGIRPVEMMHHVRKGSLWMHEERARMARMDPNADDVANGSPFPSAWRADGQIDDRQPRRAGSLRLPLSSPHRPRFGRMPSNETLRIRAAQSQSVLRESPASTGTQQVHTASFFDGSSTEYTSSTVRPDTATSENKSAARVLAYADPYSDDSPAMMYLDGQRRVEENIRAVLKDMVAQDPADRPTAEELVEIWDTLGV